MEWGGQFENLERARKRLSIILPVTIAIIFALLFSAFGDAAYAGLVLINVPFSLVGGIIALYVRNINMSVSAAVGFISLFGVAVMSGVLVVMEINRRRVEPGVPLKEAIVAGALNQMRPVLMMILVAMLGMVPAAHGNDLGGSIRHPASACGLFGLKPTRARVPLGPEYGDVLGGGATEHALTRSMRDSAALLDGTNPALRGDCAKISTARVCRCDRPHRDHGFWQSPKRAP